MFGFGKSKPETGEEQFKGEPLQYHSDLIDQLKEQQDKIYANLKRLALAVKQREMSSIESSLVTFKKSWQNYLMDKNVKLFSYLKHSADLSAQQTMDVNGARARNTKLSRDMNQMVFDYLQDGKLDVSSLDLDTFGNHLHTMGNELVEGLKEDRKVLFRIYGESAS